MIGKITSSRITLDNGYNFSRVINGGWQLSAEHCLKGQLDIDDAVKAFHMLRERGLTTFDCADIYTGQHLGRGGWSWYTGSAAWYYKVFVEDVLGVRLSAGGRILDLHPRIPFELTLRLHGTTHLRVSSELETTLDGSPAQFPVTLLDGDHTVTFRLE